MWCLANTCLRPFHPILVIYRSQQSNLDCQPIQSLQKSHNYEHLLAGILGRRPLLSSRAALTHAIFAKNQTYIPNPKLQPISALNKWKTPCFIAGAQKLRIHFCRHAVFLWVYRDTPQRNADANYLQLTIILNIPWLSDACWLTSQSLCHEFPIIHLQQFPVFTLSRPTTMLSQQANQHLATTHDKKRINKAFNIEPTSTSLHFFLLSNTWCVCVYMCKCVYV